MPSADDITETRVDQSIVSADRERLSAASDARRLDRISVWLLVGFGLAIVLLMVVLRVNASPDMAVVIAGVIAVLIGRGVPFLRDWAPFLAVFMAWELMRGIANQFGAAVHSDDIIAIERAISFGSVPTVELQELLWTGVPRFHDVFLSFVYVAHFALPVGVAFAFWLYRRRLFYPFAVTLLAISYASFVTFIFLPVAPPRFAGEYGSESLVVTDIVAAVGQSFDWHGFIWSYRNLVGNPVAAFPSMHAGYPLLATLFLWPVWRRAGIAMAVYTAVVWFAIIYLGHHYVVDVVGGAAYAVAGFFIVRWLWGRRSSTPEPLPHDELEP